MTRSTHNPARTPQRLDPETRRALLVEAAAEVFRGRDPTEVSFEEVAEAAGVSRSLVYAYFKDRGGLIAAVYMHDLDLLDRDLLAALDAGLPNQAQLERVVRRYLEYARDRKGSWALITAAGTLQHPKVQEARRQRVERIARNWSDRPDTRLVVRSILGLLESGARDWVENDDLDLERTTDLIVALLWGGLSGMEPGAVTPTA